MLGYFHFDWIEVLGLVGETLFFARLLVQWTSSEAAKKPVLPVSYWYMSLVGCVMLMAYAILIQRLAVLLPQVVGIFLYSRNLQLELRYRGRQKWRKDHGFLQPGYVWPRVSVIVPAHNEEQALAATMESLLAQSYPRESLELIVACNGCTDRTPEVARAFSAFGVKVLEDAKSGMSFGKNLGAKAATGDILVFVDADTRLPEDGLRTVVERVVAAGDCVATVEGRPDRGGPVVRGVYRFANRSCCKKGVHAPGGVMAMPSALYARVGGFDETIPMGTSTQFILRAVAAGAKYVFVRETAATTSIRRFAKSGIFGQLMRWQKAHEMLRQGRVEELSREPYEPIR